MEAYRGCRSVTAAEEDPPVACIPWDHSSYYDTYSDEVKEEAGITGGHNFCRDPNGDNGVLWCWTGEDADGYATWYECGEPVTDPDTLETVWKVPEGHSLDYSYYSDANVVDTAAPAAVETAAPTGASSAALVQLRKLKKEDTAEEKAPEEGGGGREAGPFDAGGGGLGCVGPGRDPCGGGARAGERLGPGCGPEHLRRLRLQARDRLEPGVGGLQAGGDHVAERGGLLPERERPVEG